MAENEFDLVVGALRDKGLTSDEILEVLSRVVGRLQEGCAIQRIFSGNRSPKQMTSTEKEEMLKEIFLKLGVPRHLNGYDYLIKAIMLYADNPNQKFMDELYPAVGKEFNITGGQVEGSIGHAIKRMWERCPKEMKVRMFGYTISPQKNKPTNSEFITKLAEQLK